MRSFRTWSLALVAGLLFSTSSAQADTCGDTFPSFGNVHRFIGQPMGYDVGSATRTMDALILWGDGQSDSSPMLNPGEQYHFSHSYSVPGSYDITLFVDASDPIQNVCHDSFDLGTVRVRGHGHH